MLHAHAQFLSITMHPHALLKYQFGGKLAILMLTDDTLVFSEENSIFLIFRKCFKKRYKDWLLSNYTPKKKTQTRLSEYLIQKLSNSFTIHIVFCCKIFLVNILFWFLFVCMSSPFCLCTLPLT